MGTGEREGASARERRGSPRVAIVGSGFSGLCLAIHLKKAGIDSFTIFEKSDRLGGTWRDNTYPGAACDVASFAYCFSFEQKTDWSRKWSPQPEILDYMNHCADKYGLRSHLRFDTEVTEARFDEAEALWHLRTKGGEEVVADVLVSAVGQLHRPFVPKIEGLERFRGKLFHSARWDHDYDLDGKTVAVIGNAASAIQFIPQIAPRTKQLHVFQRSANWMFPRNDRAYTEAEKRRFARHPLLAKLHRWAIWIAHELWFPVFLRNPWVTKLWQRRAIEHMRSVVADPALRRALVPDYPIGAKRILISDDYYQALCRDDVRVITDGVARITEDAVVTSTGERVEVDAIILATGFRTTEFLVPMEVEGLAGRSLQRSWKQGAQAYFGMTVAGFPNFFMMYGPNTNLGHNSIIFMIECQAGYILDCLRKMRDGDLAYLDLREDVMARYNEELQKDLDRTAWAAHIKSWYKNEAGRITNNWSSTTTRYWWHTRHADLSEYRQVKRAALEAAPSESTGTSRNEAGPGGKQAAA